MKKFTWCLAIVVAMGTCGYAVAQGHHGGAGGGAGWHGGARGAAQVGAGRGAWGVHSGSWNGGNRGGASGMSGSWRGSNWNGGQSRGSNWNGSQWRGGNGNAGNWNGASSHGGSGRGGAWHGGHYAYGHGYHSGGVVSFAFGYPYYYPYAYYGVPAYPAYVDSPPIYAQQAPMYAEPEPPIYNEPPPPVTRPPPQPIPTPERLERYTLSAQELFDFDRATLRVPQPKLDEIAGVLSRNPQIGNVKIIGYTDRIGSDSYNLKLSQRRADAVKSYLTAKGIAPTRLTAIGRGKADPVVQCPDKMGRPELIKCLEPNRRVVVEEITVERRVRASDR